MSYKKVLKESWEIVWRYRVLWVFGFLLALTTTSWETSLLTGRSESWNQDGQGIVLKRIDDNTFYIPGQGAEIDLSPADGFIIQSTTDPTDRIVVTFEDGFAVHTYGAARKGMDELHDFFSTPSGSDVADIIVGGLIAMAVVFLLILIIGAVIRYTSEAALIQGVQYYAKTGEKAGFRQVLRMGFSRTAWRFFLIDLVIRLPLALLFIILLAAALSPLLLWITGDAPAAIFGTIASAGMFILLFLGAFAINLVLSLFTHFFRRASAVENLGVKHAIGRGYRVVRSNPKDVLVMWIFMLGVSIAFILLMIPLAVILIPVFLVTVVLGAIVALPVMFVIAGLVGLFSNFVVGLIVGGMVALPIFILVTASPIYFLSGLLQVYKSSAWTLTYRELSPMTVNAPKPVAKPALQEA